MANSAKFRCWKNSSSAVALRMFALLMLFPVSLWGLVYLVRETGVRIPGPFVLIVNHSLMFVLLVLLLRHEGIALRNIGWRAPGWRRVGLELGIGLAAGVTFSLVQRFATDPVAERLCRALHWTFRGLPRAHGQPSITVIVASIVASTVFAGMVEESVYRGYAITVLRQGIGIVGALIVCLCLRRGG